jgi:predicted outer membrane repeat protein
MPRRSSPRIRTLRALTGAAVVAAAITAVAPVAAQASVACNETALVQAIDDANAAGGGNVVLEPLCTYDLATSHATGANGADGLPIITTVITLTGDQNVITRSSALGTPAFRIAEVASTGKLTLKLVTLSNGSAVGSGGAILNFGAVTLTGGGLTNNSASGGGGGLSNADVAAPGTGTAATFTSATVSGNTATGQGGGLYNGLRGSLTTSSSSITSNASSAEGGGIAAVNATATSLTSTSVSANSATGGAGGVYRLGGTMTITTSPISGNTPDNCVGSVPSVPGCVA